MINGFTLSDVEQQTGPKGEVFERAKKQFGFVPNIVNGFSESPILADTMLELYSRLGSTSFDATESHIVMQTVNVFNECTYCVPAHSTSARMGGVDDDLDDALRNGETLADPKQESLRRFTLRLVEQRGHLQGDELESFLSAGYTRQNALDVILLITVKTLTNYGNHLIGTDLDEKFKALGWSPAGYATS